MSMLPSSKLFMREPLPLQISGQDIFLGILVVFGVGALIAGIYELRKAISVSQTPNKKVKNVRGDEDDIVVEGTVEPVDSNTFTEPFDGNESVAYSYKIERESESGADDTLETIENENKQTTFYVRDGEHQILVEPEAADLQMAQKTKISLENGTSLAQRLNPARFGWETFSYYISGQSLDVNSQVSIRGTPTKKKNESSTLVFSGATNGTFIISDTDPQETVQRMWIRGGLFAALGIGFILGGGYLIIA